MPWGVIFTNALAHQNTGVPLGVRLHPTQLYESATTLAIFGVLLWWFPRKKHDGDVFLGYLGLYAVGRFLLEYLRGDEDRGFVFHHLLSASQFIALLVLVGIAAVLVWRNARGGEGLSPVPASPNLEGSPSSGKAMATVAPQRAGAANVTPGSGRKAKNPKAGGRSRPG